MPEHLLPNSALVAIAITLAVLMLRQRLRNARFWRATVTPLASIIGSGFACRAGSVMSGLAVSP